MTSCVDLVLITRLIVPKSV